MTFGVLIGWAILPNVVQKSAGFRRNGCCRSQLGLEFVLRNWFLARAAGQGDECEKRK
jgi:hypothetical protein